MSVKSLLQWFAFAQVCDNNIRISPLGVAESHISLYLYARTSVALWQTINRTRSLTSQRKIRTVPSFLVQITQARAQDDEESPSEG